ncbi:MAG: NUDIX domain-containing protein [Pseudomonadota bacterium]|nr:NUDIX domain-containing protein [Pseudomonadota bacterium]
MIPDGSFSKKPHIKQFASTIVVAPNGHLLCQLRDDIPGIIHRGCWTCCPGGSVEPGETHKEAVCREMKEEFNIKIKDIELLTTFNLNGEFAGSYSIFTSKLASPISQVQCNEGQKAEFFSPQDVLKIGLPKIAARILKKYLARIEAHI